MKIYSKSKSKIQVKIQIFSLFILFYNWMKINDTNIRQKHINNKLLYFSSIEYRNSIFVQNFIYLIKMNLNSKQMENN